MSKYNRGTVRPAVSSPVITEAVPSGRTFEGAPGYARDAKSELYLLAVSHLGEDGFYEKARDRDSRLTALVSEVATGDVPWMTGLTGWLRTEGGMRTSPATIAADSAHALDQARVPGARPLVRAALRRADEPGEIISYWHAHYGRRTPIAFKRGVADAVHDLYNEYGFLKWDSREAAIRFGDVIELVNPRYRNGERGTWRDALYRYAIESRHNRDNNPVPEQLAMIRANAALRSEAAADPSVLLSTERLRAAGMTWQNVLSLTGNGVAKRDLWAALIPLMGYEALLKNLRNFDQAGVPDDIAETVAARLADPGQVAKSGQFPFRLLSAYRAAPSLRWAYPLEKALNASLGNVPALTGRTLVLVDRSPSMWDQKFSEHSTMPWADAAAIFGAAVALRAGDADLAEFGGQNSTVTFKHGESVLKVVERFRRFDGTDIPSAVRAHYRGHDRVVIVTDEQTAPGWLPSNMQLYGGSAPMPVNALIPEQVPLYMWNFGGYRHGAAPSGGANRHTMGGLTDAAFRMVSLLEAGRDCTWPWAQTANLN